MATVGFVHVTEYCQMSVFTSALLIIFSVFLIHSFDHVTQSSDIWQFYLINLFSVTDEP
jgi:hypothetical protein